MAGHVWVAGEDDIRRTTPLPPPNKAPKGFDHFITSTEYLCEPGSLSIVPGTASSPALVTRAGWPMLHWSCKQTVKGSLAAFKREVNYLSGAPN